MRLVVQRVKNAQVSIHGQVHGKIPRGLMILVGVEDSDDEQDIKYLVHKVTHLRIFADQDNKMNFNLMRVKGQILSVSQFTLYADVSKGNRPSFFHAGRPRHAKQIYLKFNQALRDAGVHVETGVFGADMQVKLDNDGPATFILDTDNK